MLWSPNRYRIDLSNEVLDIDFGQGATKISKVTYLFGAGKPRLWNDF